MILEDQIGGDSSQLPSLSTMVQNRKKHRKNSHLIIHCPTSEGVSERVSAAEHATKASSAEQANE